MNEDQRQEYETLLLEGWSEQDAAGHARYGDALVSDHPHRGPRFGDTRTVTLAALNGTDNTFENFHFPLSDDRTDSEREDSWQRAELAQTVLEKMTPRQRQAWEYTLGLNGRPALSRREAAELMGVVPISVQTLLTAGRNRVLGKKRDRKRTV